jgi:hypothetical protein
MKYDTLKKLYTKKDDINRRIGIILNVSHEDEIPFVSRVIISRYQQFWFAPSWFERKYKTWDEVKKSDEDPLLIQSIEKDYFNFLDIDSKHQQRKIRLYDMLEACECRIRTLMFKGEE